MHIQENLSDLLEPNRNPHVLRGTIVGALGGLAAGWVMTKFQEKLGSAMKSDEDKQQPEQEQGDNATVKTARAIAEPVLDRELTPDEKRFGGPLVHYAFSASMGALYGGLTELLPGAALGFGTLFGTLLFIGADEVMVPLLKLGPPPQETPLKVHAFALASHLVYGAITEAARRGLDRALPHAA